MNRVFQVDRPRSFWDVAGVHLPWFLLSYVVIAAALWVPPSWFSTRVCLFLGATSLSCPFCGLTRGFQSIARGDLAAAATACPLATVLFTLAVIALLWNAMALIVRMRILPGTVLRRTGRKLWIGTLCAVILANWVYRLALGIT